MILYSNQHLQGFNGLPIFPQVLEKQQWELFLREDTKVRSSWMVGMGPAGSRTGRALWQMTQGPMQATEGRREPQSTGTYTFLVVASVSLERSIIP